MLHIQSGTTRRTYPANGLEETKRGKTSCGIPKTVIYGVIACIQAILRGRPVMLHEILMGWTAQITIKHQEQGVVCLIFGHQ